MEFLKKTTGYTFIEVLTAFGIFSVFLTATATIGVNFYNAQQKERARNLVLEETQFLLNRISNLVRENTIDYAEYYSDSCEDLSPPNSGNYCPNWEDPIRYGDDMGEQFRENFPGVDGSTFAAEYDRRFFYLPTCEPGETHGDDHNGDGIICDFADPNNFNEGYFNTGADNILGKISAGGNDNVDRSAILPPPDAVNPAGYEQLELYLISPDGTKKTILRRIGNKKDDDGDGLIDEDAGNFSIPDPDGNEQLGLLEMTASDFNGDTFLDGYLPAPDFDLDGNGIPDISDFQPISPSNIEIVDLRFFVAPLENPRKAFSENDRGTQIQPHVMILITVRPSAKLAKTLVGKNFTVSAQTTVSSRVLNLVSFPSS